MLFNRKYVLVSAVAAAVLSLASCGGGGGDSSAPPPSSGGGTGGNTVMGSAAKGIVINGIVTLKDSAGNVLPTTPTQILTSSNGSFTANVGNYTGPVLVEVTAGPNTTIQDEVTGVNQSASNLTGVLLESVTVVAAGQPATANITPFTTVVAQLAKRSAPMGQPVSAVLIQQAQAALATTLGFNPVTTAPVNSRDAQANAGAAPEARKQALLLAALAQFGTTNSTCEALPTRAEELACAARQFATAYSSSAISGGNASIVVNGNALSGLSQAITAVSANSEINRTGVTVVPSADPSTSALANAESNPNTPQTVVVNVPEGGFNTGDVAAVRTLFNNLRSNAAALENADLNGPLETQIADFADSINTQTFGFDFGTLEILNGTTQAGELFAAYFNPANSNNRPTSSVVGGFGIVGTTACQVFAGVPQADESGAVRSVPPTASSSGTPNGQSVGCTIFGPAVLVPGGGFAQLRHYTLYTPVQGMANTLQVNSDSRFCQFPQGYSFTNDPDTCLPDGLVLDRVSGPNTTARMSTANNGEQTAAFNGRIAAPLEFVFNPQGQPSARLLANQVTVNANFVGNDVASPGTFNGSASITTVEGTNTLTASLTNISASGSENPEGTLIGSVSATGTVESNLGVLTGTFSADNSSPGTGITSFSGRLAVGPTGSRNEVFQGQLALTQTAASANLPAVNSTAFRGTISLPQRPQLELSLQLSETLAAGGASNNPANLSFSYQQAGTTVLFTGEQTSDGREVVTFSSPTSLVTVGPFEPKRTAVVDVLRNGRKAGEFLVQESRINYTDGSFEQF